MLDEVRPLLLDREAAGAIVLDGLPAVFIVSAPWYFSWIALTDSASIRACAGS